MPARNHDPDYALLIDHLVQARRLRKLTQDDLAARLKRPQSYVSKVERLERRLDVGEWRAMAIAIGIDPAEAFAEACGLLDHIELLTDAP
jgi:transcriptional regulator with XRE-family HTH domain